MNKALLLLLLLSSVFLWTGCEAFLDFFKPRYELTIDTEGEGSVRKIPNEGKYVEGEEVTLRADAADGWYLDHWKGDIDDIEVSVSLNMDGDKSVTAVFKKVISYTLEGSWNSLDPDDDFAQVKIPPVIAADSPRTVQPFQESPRRQPERIIVRYRDDSSQTQGLQAKLSMYGSVSKTLGSSRPGRSQSARRPIAVIEPDLSKGKTFDEIVAYYNSLPGVEYAEPDYIVYAFADPNDPGYADQWNLKQLQIGLAWDTVTGSDSVTVAVIDTGVRESLSDLDSNTFVDGYDFVNDDIYADDDNEHGSHVAGTVAQWTNNNEGVAGMAYGVKVVPVKVLDQDGTGLVSDVADGIYWAVDHGAHIINLSLGLEQESKALEDACEYAYTNGVAVFAASGNDNVNAVSYPAAYDSYVMAVGATRYDKTRAYYSNYGPSLDVVAPGGDVTVDQNNDSYADGILQQTIEGYDDVTGTTDYTSGYYYYQGTSMACPHVAGLAALLLSQDASLTVDQLFHTLMDTAEDLGASGRDDQYGAGLISPVAALDGGATIYSLNTNKKNTLDPDVSPYQEWTVKATSGNIQISLTSDAGGRNLDLFLFDSAGAQVASSENTSGSEEISYYAAYPGETYTVRVELIRE